MFGKIKTVLVLVSFFSLSVSMNVYALSDGFSKHNFGVGLSFTVDTGSNDRVKSAELVNGIVRVTDEENGIPRFILEYHTFNWELKKAGIGIGPFVALQTGDQEIINAVALGVMFGLKKGKTDKLSFNLGVGISADPNVQILGEGLNPNEALPDGETEIRFKEETQYGVMIVFSTAW